MILHFANGSVAQKAIVLDAIPEPIMRSIPHTVLVEFVPNPGPPDLPAGLTEVFAYTTTFPDLTAIVQFKTVFPNFPEPFDGEPFARETVAHEFGHIVQAFLDDGHKASLEALFVPPGTTWSGGDWSDNTSEADAETIKDTHTSVPLGRRYTNRTSHKLPEASFTAWRGVHNDSIDPPPPTDFIDVTAAGARQVIDLPIAVTFSEATTGGVTERVFQWDSGLYDTFFGYMANVAAFMYCRARLSRAIDTGEFLATFHHMDFTLGGGTGPESIGPTPFPDHGHEFVGTDWYEFTVPLDVNQPAPFEDALAGDPGSMQLPYRWQYSLEQDFPDTTTPPLVEFQVMRAFVVWSPMGLIGSWVDGDGNSGPPPPPHIPSILRIALSAGAGRLKYARPNLSPAERVRLQRRVKGNEAPPLVFN